MLIDEIEVTLQAGHGGAGKVSFNPGRFGGPNGGNGGKGGDIYLTVTSDLTALNQFSKKNFLTAEDGQPGDLQRRTGKDGADLTISLPIGTSVIDSTTGTEIELNSLDQKVLICEGGLGGKGNWEFKSPTNTAPKYAQPGLKGEEKHLKLILKLIADYGLIGLPNAGKSSLLNELTSANAKVGSYPFTTLEPNLGVLNGKVIADIPGLIEGASLGKGLGIKFLKHIEKVRLLIHCISCESTDIKADYQIIRDELKAFNSELLNKEEIILLTKTDLITKEELQTKLRTLKPLKKQISEISIHDWESLEKLKQVLT